MTVSFDGVTLPFAPRKQAAIMWYLLTDRLFFEHAKTKIKPQWFTDQIVGKTYSALIEFHAQFKRLPSKPEFVDSNRFLIEEPTVRSAMRAAVEMAYNESRVYGLDVLKNELTDWLHAYIYKDGMLAAADHFQHQRYSEAYSIASERMKLIQETRFDEDCEFDFSGLVEGLQASEERVLDGCTFGLKMIDDALTPGGMTGSGGLFRGDTTCLMAPVGVGKTSTMVSVVSANIQANRRCLLLIHEGEATDIRDKLLCNLLQLNRTDLWALRTYDGGRRCLVAIEQVLKERLTFIPYIKAQMTIESVLPLIRRKCDEANSQGRPYCLLADDYPELLLSEYAQSARMEERARIQTVYLIFTQLASELNLHCLVNAQTNRDGSRANKAEDRLLSIEDIAESWGVMQKMTNVITLNRSPGDMVKNRLTYLIAKSRSSATGRAIVCRTDFGKCITHSDREGFGAAYYQASGKMIAGDELDALLPMCAGGEITAERVKKYEDTQAAEKAKEK